MPTACEPTVGRETSNVFIAACPRELSPSRARARRSSSLSLPPRRQEPGTRQSSRWTSAVCDARNPCFLTLEPCCAWFRDLAAVASGADDVVLNADRRDQLAEDAQGLDPARAREAVEWVLDTRRRLRVNVSEELALEARWLRLAA